MNDGPECQKSEQVLDLTLRGPQRGKEASYYKYVSLFSPNSLMNFVRSTYPAISNGVIRVFQAYILLAQLCYFPSRDRPKPKFPLSAETEYFALSKCQIFCRNQIFCRILNILLNTEYSAKMPDIWHLNCKFSDI